MKKVLNIFKGLLIAIWVMVAIVTTVLLISFNKYGVSELGNYSVFIVDNERLEPNFLKHDIVVVEKVAENKYNVGDEVFFYMTNPSDEVFINHGEITKIIEADHAEDSYFFGDEQISYSKMIGQAKDAKVYHKWGFVLSILESRWGFMFFIIFPTIFAVVYEIYSIIEELKSKDEDDEE